MEKFDFYSDKVMQSTWKNKNSCNNNNHSEVNHYCKEVDQCHCKMVPKEKDELKCEDAKGIAIAICDKEPAIEKPNIDDHSSDGGHINKHVVSPINSNRTSRNNSTDNLSYCSDNYYGDELLLLQNALSDDELYLNSDDCVYAYRGGGDFEIPLERREENADDETDFLEMDFDPDPSSEIEPHAQVQNAVINVQYLNADDDERQHYFGSPVGKVSDERVFSLSSNNSDKNSSTPVRMSHIKESCADNQNQLTLTGARPKQTSDKSYCSSNRTRKDSKQRESDKFIGCNLHEITASIFGCYLKEQDETCLDCLESEFLAKTIGKPIDSSFCPRCKLNRNRLSYNSNSNRSISNGNDISQMNRATTNFDVNDMILPSKDLPKLFLDHFGTTNQMMKGTEKNTSKFSSKSVNENILVQALDKLDIQYNADEIKEYFNKLNPDYFDIAEFICSESKKQCDYKSIVKLLHSASKEALRIRFETDIRLTDSEDVEVRTHDILKIWSKNKNLDRVKKLKYKFKQMNVLGKIINVIRQAQQRLEKPLPDYILVPQYYKTGYISIERINF